MESYLQSLNQQQFQAVEETDGRIRVVAGAGSGKTKTLASRYSYLVDKLGISPAHILCLTFTNKAANEMRQRISKMVDAGNVNDFICTIHGFCVKVLRRDIYRMGYSKKFVILDEEDRKTIAKQVIAEFDLDRETYTVKKFLQIIDNFKNGTDYISTYMLPNSNSKPSKKEEKLFFAYLSRQLKTFSLDFNDLINFTLYILQTYKEVREYWQEEIEYIMLDEAQDCNQTDWTILEILAEKHKNLFIVGDPDQCIYEWRGAQVDMFLNFENRKTIILNQNYRSTPNILNVANCIIKNNVDRLDKDLFTLRNEGKTVVHFHGRNDGEEMQWVIKQIIEAHKAGIAYKDFCILYRSSNMTRILEQELIKKHIPYKIYGGIRFYERKEIKDALSYLRMVDQNDDASFLRIINEPSRKLGKVFIEKVTNYAQENNLLLYDALEEMVNSELIIKESAVDFVDLIQSAKNLQFTYTISELLDYLLKESTYKDMLRHDEDEERLENLEELKHSIEYYEQANVNEDISLTSFLQDIALYTNTDSDMSSDVVKLMTIHQSKGLEFPYVFIINLFDGGLPNYRSVRDKNKKGMEEERRLMYVAITRAENVLFLTESEGYDFAVQGNKYPSRFLREIQRQLFVTEGKMDESLWEQTDNLIKQFKSQEDEYIEEECEEFYVNDIVEHEVFGYGKIVQVNDNGTCKVLFKNGTRTLKNEAIFVVADGDERDIDFESGKPIDETPIEIAADAPIFAKKTNKLDYFLLVGTEIKHPVWGIGIVSKVYREKAEKRCLVKFKDGEHSLNLEYTQFILKDRPKTKSKKR